MENAMRFREMLTSKGLLLLLMLQAISVFMPFGWPMLVESSAGNKASDQELYTGFFDSYSRQQYGQAAMYLWAYIQRDPADYIHNTDFRAAVDKKMVELAQRVAYAETMARNVRIHLDNCDCYPCNNCTTTGSVTGVFLEVPPTPLQPPPSMALICQSTDFKGKCELLEVGEYTRWQQLGLANDSISSLWVGASVTLTLCVHKLDLIADCMTFTGSDSNLSNNFLPGKNYSMNDNASSARVGLR
jgi:hypothetical protein